VDSHVDDGLTPCPPEDTGVAVRVDDLGEDREDIDAKPSRVSHRTAPWVRR